MLLYGFTFVYAFAVVYGIAVVCAFTVVQGFTVVYGDTLPDDPVVRTDRVANAACSTYCCRQLCTDVSAVPDITARIHPSERCVL